MKNSNKMLILLLLSFLCGNVFADSRSYKIEMLIFSQELPNTETFDQTESMIEWPRRLSDRSAYTAVNSSLGDSYSRLNSSDNYQPIMHVAWVQSVQSNRYGRGVKISNPAGTINGYFQLQRGHLVHMIADLEYSDGSAVYRISEKRRFKLKETHYLDHPKFGVLVRVSPY
jgi:hypothetical protein